ncbi:MAG: P-loop NTPase fold protein [Endomicrobiaceae bacterium]|nr:P-loop NTPase fold protein [Endomicrobiaceae bacterium]
MVLTLDKNKEKTIEDIRDYLKKDKNNHPFDDDLLNLKSLAETLSNIIVNTKDPFVYSINSPYGTGKTFFLRRFHCLLEQKNCLTVSYNAWESDFYSDPLSALIGELANQIDPKKFKNIEKEVAILTNASLDFSVSLPGFFAITLRNLFSKKQKLSNAYQEHKKRKEKFIETLKNFTGKLSFPLIFIIDELDRCRPDYAIQTLEIIKHFFNIPNITFVIGVDRKQIESTVRVLYGSNIDICCDEYLRKFIDQDFYLPKLSSKKYIENLCNKHLTTAIQNFCGDKNFFSIYKQNLFSPILEHKCNLDFFRHALSTVRYDTDCAPIKEQFTNITINVITEYIDALSEYFVFSLRKQEQFVISLKILFSLLSEKDILLPELACLLTAIKLYDHSMLYKPKNAILQMLLYKIPYDLNSPEITKLVNKSEGIIKKEKLSQIETETTDIETKLNVISFWNKCLSEYQILHGKYRELSKSLNPIANKYLLLVRQLSLLEKQ